MNESLLRIFQESQHRLDDAQQEYIQEVINELDTEFYQVYEGFIEARIAQFWNNGEISAFSAAMKLYDEEGELMEKKLKSQGVPQEEIDRRLEQL